MVLVVFYFGFILFSDCFGQFDFRSLFAPSCKMPAKQFSFTWIDPTGEWSYCYGKCVFVSLGWVGDFPRKCRFLVKPDDCTGYMPYESGGSGHVELFDDVIYLKSAKVEPCICDPECSYFVWNCVIDRIVSKESLCEA